MTARIQSALRRTGRTVIACTLGVGLLFTAACTSASSDAAETTSAGGSAAESTPAGSGEASQMQTTVESSYDPTPAVPSDGAPASAVGPTADPTTTAAPVSTSGPAPVSGDINQVVPEVTMPTNPPVPLTGTADFGGQITARLSEVTPIDATAKIPGEISGPALQVTVEITNGSADAIGLDSVSVNLATKDGTPASPITTDPAAPLSGVLAPGEKRSGVYVFTVPTDALGDVSVDVLYSAGAPIVLFQGSATGG